MKTKETPMPKIPFRVTVDMLVYADSAEDAKSKANFILNRGISYSPSKYREDIDIVLIYNKDPFKL